MDNIITTSTDSSFVHNNKSSSSSPLFLNNINSINKIHTEKDNSNNSVNILEKSKNKIHLISHNNSNNSNNNNDSFNILMNESVTRTSNSWSSIISRYSKGGSIDNIDKITTKVNEDFNISFPLSSNLHLKSIDQSIKSPTQQDQHRLEREYQHRLDREYIAKFERESQIRLQRVNQVRLEREILEKQQRERQLQEKKDKQLSPQKSNDLKFTPVLFNNHNHNHNNINNNKNNKNNSKKKSEVDKFNMIFEQPYIKEITSSSEEDSSDVAIDPIDLIYSPLSSPMSPLKRHHTVDLSDEHTLRSMRLKKIKPDTPYNDTKTAAIIVPSTQTNSNSSSTFNQANFMSSFSLVSPSDSSVVTPPKQKRKYTKRKVKEGMEEKKSKEEEQVESITSLTSVMKLPKKEPQTIPTTTTASTTVSPMSDIQDELKRNLCNKCVNWLFIQNDKVNASVLDTLEKVRVCSAHGNIVELYCFDCVDVLCIKCTKPHNHHHYDYAENIKKEILENSNSNNNNENSDNNNNNNNNENNNNNNEIFIDNNNSDKNCILCDGSNNRKTTIGGLTDDSRYATIDFKDLLLKQDQICKTKSIESTVLSKAFGRYALNKYKALANSTIATRFPTIIKVLKRVITKSTIWPHRLLKCDEGRIMNNYGVSKKILVQFLKILFNEPLRVPTKDQKNKI